MMKVMRRRVTGALVKPEVSIVLYACGDARAVWIQVEDLFECGMEDGDFCRDGRLELPEVWVNMTSCLLSTFFLQLSSSSLTMRRSPREYGYDLSFINDKYLPTPNPPVPPTQLHALNHTERNPPTLPVNPQRSNVPYIHLLLLPPSPAPQKSP